jgi:hypothetical protein
MEYNGMESLGRKNNVRKVLAEKVFDNVDLEE